MQKIILTIVLLTSCLCACKKKDTTSPGTSSSPCSGFNVCFSLDGKEYKANAKWYLIPGSSKYRINFETGSAGTATYQNFEMDMVGNTVGTYNITVPALSAGQGSFQVYEGSSSTATTYNGKSGTITISSVAADQWTGTFSISTDKNGSGSFATSSGSFTAVPKK